MGLLRKALGAVGVLVGDAIESYGANESRAELQERLRVAADRGAELALENARLRDRVDSLRFNGPTLWRDEVDAITHFVNMYAHQRFADQDGDAADTLKRLLNRCDHMGVTLAELNEQVEGIIDGTADVHLWDDVGADVDDPYEGSWREAADNEGARLARKASEDE